MSKFQRLSGVKLLLVVFIISMNFVYLDVVVFPLSLGVSISTCLFDLNHKA